MPSRRSGPPTSVIVAVVALAAIIVAAVVALSIVGIESRTTPAIATLVAFIGPIFVAIFALARAERAGEHAADASEAANRVDRKLNGELERIVRDEVRRIARGERGFDAD